MHKKLLITLSILASFSYADCDSIDHDVLAFMKKNGVTGVAIAMINNGDTEYCNYGYADRAKQKKVTENTIFGIASITKTFTANLAAIAQVEGKYDINKPITTYLPELDNQYYTQINSIELLTHTANIPFTVAKTSTESDVFDSLNQVKYSLKPQTKYMYSNAGISMVGIALQHVYKQDYQTVLDNLLLKKLDMKNTFINVPSKYSASIANGFDQRNKLTSLPPVSVLAPAASLKSTTHDLAIYLNYQMNGSPYQTLDNALKIIHKDYYCIDDERYQQLVWVHFPSKSLNAKYVDKQTLLTQNVKNNCKTDSGFIEKTGTLNSMSSYIVYNPTKKIGLVLLINKGQVADRVALSRKILKNMQD